MTEGCRRAKEDTHTSSDPSRPDARETIQARCCLGRFVRMYELGALTFYDEGGNVIPLKPADP